LRRRGIAVRAFSTGELRTCIRVGALDESATAELVNALNEVLPAFVGRQLASA
jgi:histidinol-phosphate/aromatic aminotransferase/cobyric acid decarboxylase-like protein